MNQTYTMIAKTLAGLEDVLAEELAHLGAEEVEIGRRMVSFKGDKRLMYKANISLRTALKILVPIYEFDAEDTDLLYASLVRFDWKSIMDTQSTFAVDTVAYSHIFTHTQFITYKTKDAIVDYFSAQDPEGKRPSVRVSNPDLVIHVHIAEKHVTLSLDSSGESLHKRGYRVGQGKAPINEVLAAGILLKAGWKGETDFLDPFAGSGTFLIEAALIARNIPPGIFRERYAFEKWKNFDEELYKEVFEDASEERPFDHKIWGSDISFEAVSTAKANINRAGLQHDIEIRKANFKDVTPPSKPCLVVMNPPYGERINQFDTEKLYEMIGSTLKKQFSGCTAWVIADKKEHFVAIALKQTTREMLYNGAIECELRSYDLFEGKHKEYKTEQNEGRRPTNDRRERSDKPHSRTGYPARGDRKKDFRGDRRDFKGERKAFGDDRREFKTDRKAPREDRKDFRNDRREPRGDRKEFQDKGFKKERSGNPNFRSDRRDDRGERRENNRNFRKEFKKAFDQERERKTEFASRKHHSSELNTLRAFVHEGEDSSRKSSRTQADKIQVFGHEE